MLESILQFGALFCFSGASFGFLFFRFRYPRRSSMRLWGTRFCHLLGFLGLALHAIFHDGFTEVSALVASALAVSILGHEMGERFLP